MNKIETQNAIALLETGRNIPLVSHTDKDVDNACKIEVEALREKQEREKAQAECEYCNNNRCWGCEYAGECRTVEHCRSTNKGDYKARRNYCHICGRKLEEEHNG